MTTSEKLRGMAEVSLFAHRKHWLLESAAELEALREERDGLKREYVELGGYIADRVGIERQPDFDSTISEITKTIFDLRFQNRVLREACYQPVYSTAELATPGKLVCIRCRLCGAECKNREQMEHDSDCALARAEEGK